VTENVTIEVRENGPYKITGPVTMVDHTGKPIAIEEGRTSIFLCRCGQSSDKPFCDGTHKRAGWCATLVEEAPEAG
jgi:CDGSH iron-sulfur domain-containing protein 3